MKRVLRRFGRVKATPDFAPAPQVIAGAPDLFFEPWGTQNGGHARTAVGLAALPRGIAVEVDCELEPGRALVARVEELYSAHPAARYSSGCRRASR